MRTNCRYSVGIKKNLNKFREVSGRRGSFKPPTLACVYGEPWMRRSSAYAHCGRRQAALGGSCLQTHRLPGLKKEVRYLVVHAPSNNTHPMTRHAARRILQPHVELIPVRPHRDAPSLQWEEAGLKASMSQTPGAPRLHFNI